MTPQQQAWERVAAFYNEGCNAYTSGKPCHCPYGPDTARGRAWTSGYYAYHKG